MIYKYLIGAAIGGLFGYFVMYKLIGCSNGSCPITKSPIVSTIVGILLGVLLVFAIFPAAKPAEENNTSVSSTQSVVASVNSTTTGSAESAPSVVVSEPSGEPNTSASLSAVQSVVTSAASSVESTSSSQSAVPAYQRITAKQAKARMDSGDKVIVVDVRTQSEYDSGHIRGAVLISNETIIDTKPELLPDLNAEILVYCRSGNRSAQAAKKLIAMGYTNVFDFGGIIDWPYEILTAGQ